MCITLVFGVGPHIFAWRVLVQTPPGGSGAGVDGSAFGRPCEGAVVCAWGGDPTFLHGESGCKRHLEDWVPGSMEARLTDLAKARLFALGAETPHFAWRVRVLTPPGGSGARVNGSAFGRPCEGVVVCVWGGDPAFWHGESGCRHHLEDRVPGSLEARLADLVKALLFALGAGTPRFGMVSPGQTPPG